MQEPLGQFAADLHDAGLIEAEISQMPEADRAAWVTARLPNLQPGQSTPTKASGETT